jgi:hypothetical protein
VSRSVVRKSHERLRRVIIYLDPLVPEDRVISNALLRLPRGRRSAWARDVIISGMSFDRRGRKGRENLARDLDDGGVDGDFNPGGKKLQPGSG